MRIFGIADLHFSFCHGVTAPVWQEVKVHKPMGIFGLHWEEHYQKIYDAWMAIIKENDIVLVPGDISWGTRLADAAHDLDFLGQLPGKIVLVQGNHDYWWQSISRVRAALPANVYALQNDSLDVGSVLVYGTRGWICPNGFGYNSEQHKIYLRELQRLELSLKSNMQQAVPKVVMMHFMPVNEKHEKSGFIELMEQYQVQCCVYGHLHSEAHKFRLEHNRWGIDFFLVSADYLNFSPKLLWEIP